MTGFSFTNSATTDVISFIEGISIS